MTEKEREESRLASANLQKMLQRQVRELTDAWPRLWKIYEKLHSMPEAEKSQPQKDVQLLISTLGTSELKQQIDVHRVKDLN